MKRFNLCIVLMWSAILISGGYAQEAARRFISTGRPIASQLFGTDRRVVMETNEVRPIMVTLPGPKRDRIETLVETCEVIATGRVEEVISRPVARNRMLETPTASEANANWIMSTVRFRVDRVIKDSTNGVAENGILEWEQSGGTAQIGGVTVEAIVPWRLPVVAKRRYLFCRLTSNGRVSVVSEITGDGRLKKLQQPELPREPSDSPPFEEYDTLGAEELLGMLEAETQRRRPPQ